MIKSVLGRYNFVIKHYKSHDIYICLCTWNQESSQQNITWLMWCIYIKEMTNKVLSIIDLYLFCQNLEKYLHIWLLFSIICTQLFENNLISLNQYDFNQGESCINPVLPITRGIYHSLNERSEEHVFVEISKAFNKVWHKGLLFKLKKNGFNRPLLQVLNFF